MDSNKNKSDLVNQAVNKIFSELKDFIVIGLTGRTGAGCTTVGNLLQRSFKELQPPIPRISTMCMEDSIFDIRQYSIIYDYCKETWEEFQLIKMSHIIFTFILENDFEKTSKFFEGIDFSAFKGKYNNLHKKICDFMKKVNKLIDNGDNVPCDDEIYKFYFEKIPKAYGEFKEIIGIAKYTPFMQKIGDNIRASGCAYSRDINPDNIFALSQRVNMLIKILRRRNLNKNKKVLVVIDSFRNPYEVIFFKKRYAAFYLFSINATNDERKNRLLHLKQLTLDDIKKLDKREYPSLDNSISDFYQINIQKTIEIADIHINNQESSNGNYGETKKQLIRYITLIIHPGLVQPTPVEYCMQVAYCSRVRSGCLSRQVGAVISDSNYNILATGWNDAPMGQMPCNLRNVLSLTDEGRDDGCAMSDFERIDPEYKKFLKDKIFNINMSKLKGRNCSYCFKDAYNSYRKRKNQVYTRSVHAEEMAFLQAAKIGIGPFKGGVLFTTDSPCELCAKKAVQVGISKIFYIDTYPGISESHILNCGMDRPKMQLFYGAIGGAYIQLYKQILPIKDEIYMLLDLTFKEE